MTHLWWSNHLSQVHKRLCWLMNLLIQYFKHPLTQFRSPVCKSKATNIDAAMDIYLGHLINWELQKLSSLIGQLATVHNCDWLLKKKRIYKLSSISPWWHRRCYWEPPPPKNTFMYLWSLRRISYGVGVGYTSDACLNCDVKMARSNFVRKEWRRPVMVW